MSAYAIPHRLRHSKRRRRIGAALLAMAAAGRGRGRKRHHRRGIPPDMDVLWFRHGGPPFGPGGPFFGRGGPRARRGDVRTAALLLLAEGPLNGYQIMQELEERSGGVWRPSPGSVYPALQQLEDEGLVHETEQGGRRVFELTDEGRAYIEERGDDLEPPWEEMTGDFSDDMRQAASLMREVALAFSQVMRAGSPPQIAEASNVLADTRRSLYRILAEGDAS